ncbi:hypothetical protein GCM10025770_26780 [Viridibacterium curvum]|uniref:Uncharacterized protein n=1 Tax=Viridibacterium curvum TaxID=1101404 RepID=A0ABP9QV20_9RHOO
MLVEQLPEQHLHFVGLVFLCGHHDELVEQRGLQQRGIEQFVAVLVVGSIIQLFGCFFGRVVELEQLQRGFVGER